MYNLIVILFSLMAMLQQNQGALERWQIPNYQVAETIDETIIRNKEAVVVVRGYGFSNRNSSLSNGYVESSQGTGFIVNDNGTIITNKHVVGDREMKYWITTNNGNRYPVETIDRDPINDVAIIKINPEEHPDNTLRALELGDSNTVSAGQRIVALSETPGNSETDMLSGNVLGTGGTVIAGDPKDRRKEKLENVIETNLDLVPGNSGSPLLDTSGKVVGINTATATEWKNISFAIPINTAKDYLESLE